MQTFRLSELTPMKAQALLQGAIAPRPICFASTVDAQGQVNLSPYSFFNLFSSNPPVVIFSPARRVRDNTTKHTLQNIHEVAEVCINMVSYEMVEQTSLASTEYAKGVNEFEKAGFTMLKSEFIRPPRVAEAPVQLECKVMQVIPLGDQGGAGNLVLAEVVLMHVNPTILNEQGTIDPKKIDLVARLGGDWYSRSSAGLFEVAKPLTTLGIGVDAIPAWVKQHPLFNGNDLGRLGNVERLPSGDEVDAATTLPHLTELIERLSRDPEELLERVLEYSLEASRSGRNHEAWTLLGLCDKIRKAHNL